MEKIDAKGTTLAYEVRGSGEPVIFIHGALIADTFQPLMEEPALKDFQLIRYHRRGYGDSGPAESPVTIERGADDCLSLVKSLGAEPAHVVGHSGGGVIALEVVRRAPGAVRSLTLMEPALLDVPSGPQLMAQVGHVLQLYITGDKKGATEGFIEGVCGPGSCETANSRLQGAMRQGVEDADTFFGKEFPGFGGWSFNADDAARIRQPVLAVTGADSCERASWPGYAEIQQRLLDWFPQVTEFVLPGSGHFLQVENPRDMAEGLAKFLQSV